MVLKFVFVALLAGVFFAVRTATAGAPTHSNVRYSPEFDRSTLDIWLPRANKPAPLIVFFHGGGFKGGDKARIPFREEFMRLVGDGVAVASVGYPLLGDQGESGRIGGSDYDRILAHTNEAIRFLRDNADQYNLDREQFVVAGSSAGALISQHLAYREQLGVKACIAIQQPYALDGVLKVIQSGGVPRVMFTGSGPEDSVHSPEYARIVKQHCDSVGVHCEVFGSQRSGLPKIPAGKEFIPYAFSILSPTWQATSSSD